jgi:lipooligosaccharide transport system permease protein
VITRLDLPSFRRSTRMVQRSLTVYKHTWMVIVSGFFEPLFYLVAIGFGLGALVPGIDGISYAAFVAPGLLASSCLNGALTDGFFNTFFKLHEAKTYEGVLATPMRLPDVAFGELLWAVLRGSLYAASFLIVLLVLGAVAGAPLLLSPTALLALPAAVLIAAAFSALALAATSLVRTIHDFDLVMGLAVMPMFLFSGIFFPITQLPAWGQWLATVSPLYHAVSVLRQLTTGTVDLSMAGHFAYLLAVGCGGFLVAMRHLERRLVK